MNNGFFNLKEGDFVLACDEYSRDALIHRIVMILADHGLVCGNADAVERINFSELSLFGESCTCHSRKLTVETEVVLEGDGSKSL